MKAEKDMLPAEFTVEAALLVPILLAVVFLCLQSVLYLHDTVWTEAWLGQRTWAARWREETGTKVLSGSAAAEPLTAADVPKLSVLRWSGGGLKKHWLSVEGDATFEVCLLPRFVTLIFAGSPETVSRESSERVFDTPLFLRLAGAILEEMED